MRHHTRSLVRRTVRCRLRLAAALASAALVASGAAHAAAVVVVPGAAASYVELPRFAASRANTGIAIHDIDEPGLLDAVRDAGFSFVRTDLFWEAVETPGGWDFSKYDALVANLAERGLGALFILGYQHPRHSPKQPPTTPAQLAAFRAYAYQSALRYRHDAVRFEVWNEQNHPTYWLAAPSAAGYRNLLKTAVQAVRQANPAAQVATGGVQQIDRSFIRAVGDIGAGAQSAPDAVSVHPYRQGNPETALDDYRVLRRDLSAYRRVPEIWATEWSYPSVGYAYVADLADGHAPRARARQANYAARRLLVDWIAQIGLSAYYDIRDDGPDPKNMEHNFGLLNAQGEPLPAYVAVKRLFAFTAHAAHAAYRMDPTGRYIVLKLSDGAATRYAVWCYGPGNAVTVDLSRLPPAEATATDLYGAPRAAHNGLVTLREDQGPLYIGPDG
ncbi:cellulase family glycosylhydrolase [Burkholderia alba]|uniref:cellulase family glycosylhydrolase n=1 Tax=Burkholderia alba TaxID=2683677 RepID=UPI002B05D459|nr:cellulase family glycosylhydrolase [Burkholderia alba]